MGKSAAFWAVLLTRDVNTTVVAVRAVAVGTRRSQISRAEARKRRRRPAAQAPVCSRQEQIVRRGQEVLPADHRQARLVDRQIRQIRAFRSMGPHIAGGRTKLMIHHHTQRAIAVVHHTDPIRRAIEPVAVVRLLTRINHLTEHRTTFRSHKERRRW